LTWCSPESPVDPFLTVAPLPVWAIQSLTAHHFHAIDSCFQVEARSLGSPEFRDLCTQVQLIKPFFFDRFDSLRDFRHHVDVPDAFVIRDELKKLDGASSNFPGATFDRCKVQGVYDCRLKRNHVLRNVRVKVAAQDVVGQVYDFFEDSIEVFMCSRFVARLVAAMILKCCTASGGLSLLGLLSLSFVKHYDPITLRAILAP